MAKSLKLVKAKKENIFSQVQKIFDMTKLLSDENVKKEFVISAKSVDRLRNEFSNTLDLYHELELEQDEDYDPSYAPLNCIDEMCNNIKAILSKLESTMKAKQKTETDVGLVSNQCSMPRLPKLEISDFDGSPEKWPVFYQMFTKLIHENNSLSDLEKISYLVSYLQGPAKSLCTGVLPTAENYKTLFESLVKRYDDKRQLASAYLSKIVDFKPIPQESEKSLNLFLETFVESVAALKQLDLPDLLDYVFVHVALKKLDAETSRQFEMAFRKEEMPTFGNLVNFVRQQTKILSRSKPSSTFVPKVAIAKPNYQPVKSSHSFVVQNSVNNVNKSVGLPKNVCFLCEKGAHQLYFCPVFHGKTVSERWSLVKSHYACYNCLSINSHKANDCQSKNCCSTCKKRHHSLLHHTELATQNENPPRQPANSSDYRKTHVSKPAPVASVPTENRNQTLCSSSLTAHSQNAMVLLATAMVNVKDAQGNSHSLRALIDNGSQSHLISTECAKKLGLKETAFTSVVKGVGSGKLLPKKSMLLTFSSHVHPDTSFKISALVTDFLEDCLPSTNVCLENLSHLLFLPLADPNFHIKGRVDMLIGAALWPHLLRQDVILGPPGTPAAMETALGYIVMGEIATPLHTQNTQTFCAILDEPKLDQLVQRFWALEDIPTKKVLSADENLCEEFFQKTCTRLGNGTFGVGLPFKKSPALLGSSKELCIAKYLAQEKRLLQKPDVELLYSSVMKENLQKNYMSWVSNVNDAPPDAHYLPHHGVYKPESTSTPLRVVYNGSAPTSNSITLNSILHVGSKLYPEIFDILLRFRLFKYAITADVSKMYLQIQVLPEYRKYQRLIWRFSPEELLQVYELNTVVFGLTSSPFIAQRVIRLLADLEKSKFPLASTIALQDIYMDDLVHSTKDEPAAIETYNQMKEMFASGGFTLTKWSSNSEDLMKIIPQDLKQKKNLDLEKECTTKVLGVQWSAQNDVLILKIDKPENVCTKRNILSVVARTFDILGLIAPVLITAKILVQDLWSLNIGWDEEPPPEIASKWKIFCEELTQLSTIQFPRHVGIEAETQTSLIGFADASSKAYGAAVYIRTCNAKGEVEVHLLCAKTRVAPLKLKSIPRLELCAALLLSKLINHIVTVFSNNHTFDKIIAFSDSTVTLYWIKSNPTKWKVFVANRIAQIQENLSPVHWRHVPGKENPSDCLSRGLTPTALLNHNLWFHGPTWLKLDEENWPSKELVETSPEDLHKEAKITMTVAAVTQEPFPLEGVLERVSTFKKLLKSTAFILRFLQKKPVKDSPLTPDDMKAAEELWIKEMQKRHFSEVIEALKDGKPCPKNLRHLDPFLENDLLMVGGRLHYADIPYSQRHPILLPKNNRFVDLLIDHYHQENLHTGAHLVLSLLSLKYWIISARNQVKKRIRLCNICFKAKPKPLYPKMAPLPKLRLQSDVKAFAHSGVDYAGPISIILAKRRGAKTQKAYICLFVCLVVKAVHLELVTELSTTAFLNAFKRFLSRRGPCSLMVSDCGTNFIGAKNQLDDLNKFICSKDYNTEIEKELVNRHIKWQFNPPAAPHFGGIWESNVKCVKSHLRKVIGQQILTYEELNTLLIQIEALLNSRPLCTLTNDPNSPKALTPAHFLTLGPTLDVLPAEDVAEIPENRLTRFKLLDKLLQHFWKRWSCEYLQTLQSRRKWDTDAKELTEGTVVIVKKDNTPPLEWPLGVIKSTFPGIDGTVRVVDVQTKDGILRRPVVKICPLPSQ